jgi:hypothetical protein
MRQEAEKIFLPSLARLYLIKWRKPDYWSNLEGVRPPNQVLRNEHTLR